MRKLVRKSEIYKQKEGTINKLKHENDKADASFEIEANIRQMIATYGFIPDELINQAKEQLYLDNRGNEKNVNEKMKEINDVFEYFDRLPAKIRKAFKDDKQYFYQSICNGEYDLMQEYGIFEPQQIEEFKKQRLAKQKKIDEMTAQINDLQSQLDVYEQNFMLTTETYKGGEDDGTDTAN